MARKLDVLVPQYNETEEVIKPLLDSLAIQQHCDFTTDIGVIIVNDGSDEKYYLSDEFLNSYPFPIEYYKEKHRGVSATRQSALDHSTADYVIFCDADDMFYNVCAWYILSREMVDGFDSIVSLFIEETKDPKTGKTIYVNHEMDTTFVHGKVHRRKYLIEQNIKWNPDLTIHEDSFFNIQCQKLSNNVKYCPYPFYLWKWRDNSVCRHDPKYMLKTYNNMIDSVDALINVFLDKDRKPQARELTTHILYDAYFTMNKKEWIGQENQEYRNNTEKRFAKFFNDYKYLYDDIDESTKLQIIMNLKNRMYAEGLVMESITFDDWINHIKTL